MNKEELIKKLNEIIETKNLKKSEVEEKIGFPKNGLSNILSGKKELPDKWVQPIEMYVVLLTAGASVEGSKEILPANKIEDLQFEMVEEDIKEQNGNHSKVAAVKEFVLSKPKMNNAEKLKTLRLTMDKIDKDFGKGSVQLMGDAPQEKIEFISTGSIGLDHALGIGGLPKGRIVEIYGPESSGKTTLAIHVIKEAQKKGEMCAFIDAEHAFDSEYAKNIGVDIDELLISQPDYGEQALEIADRLIVSGSVGVIVIDSVAALVPKSELEGEMGDSKMGLHARLMSQACRKLTAVISKTNTVCIFINQLRSKIGVIMGNPEVTTGGNALKFYASIRLDVRKLASLKDGEEQYGNRVKVKVVKNKVAPPFKVTEFDIIYGKGIDRSGEILDMAVLKGVIQKAGSWFSYNGNKLGQGRDQVSSLLSDNEELLSEIEKKILTN